MGLTNAPAETPRERSERGVRAVHDRREFVERSETNVD
jgi:hypothetical protein